MPNTVMPVLSPTRRQFAAMSVAAAAATGFSGSANAAALPVAEREIAGVTSAKLIQPIAGQNPGLLMFASAAASPSANAAIARQLAGQGWAVMLVDATRSDEPEVNALAKRYIAILAAQPGVAEADGYVLRGFSAAEPALSLASRERREQAATKGMLFAMPATASKDSAKRDCLSSATRSLYRLAA